MRPVEFALPRWRALRPVAIALSAAVLALGLGACSASRQAGYQGASWAGAQPPVPAPSRHAAYEPSPGDPIPDAPIEPRAGARQMPDDPNEPFSPNYGGPRNQPLAKVTDAAAVPAQQPARSALPQPETSGSRAYFRRVTTASAD